MQISPRPFGRGFCYAVGTAPRCRGCEYQRSAEAAELPRSRQRLPTKSTLIEASASFQTRVCYLNRGSHPMCDYSLHAVATRPARVGETLITTTFRGTSTRGFASESDPTVAVCMLPGTELAFADDVKYDNRWIWTKTAGFRVGKFNQIDMEVRDRHHDAIEFPDGSRVLVTQLCEGQRASVLQLPVTHAIGEHAQPERTQTATPRRPTVFVG